MDKIPNYLLSVVLFKDITLTSTLSSGTTLFDSYPKYTASNTSYSLGANVSVGSSGVSGGISASVSFTSKAIDVTNDSNSASGKVSIKIYHNVSWWIWDWARFKYAQQENCQLFSFSVLSSSKTSTQTLKFTSNYGTSGSKITSWTGWASFVRSLSSYTSGSLSITY